MMNRKRFKDACENITGVKRVRNGIGTFGEKTLHAVLKQYLEPDESKHEVRLGAYIADIVTDNGVIEIQTRGLDKLRKKLTEFLEDYTVTVVYPIPKTKWLLWIDEQTGETTKRRKSPKQGRIYDAINELYKIKLLLRHPNLRLCLMLIDMDEYRYLNGWSRDKKKGSVCCERIPVDLTEEIYFTCRDDFQRFIPSELDTQFTTKDYRGVTKTNMHISQTALNILSNIGVIKRIGKQGNMHIYERVQTL